MNGIDLRRYDMLARVKEFGVEHSDKFLPVNVGGQLFAVVASTVATLSQEAASQVTGLSAARESTTSKAAARAALLDTLEAMHRTARILAIDTVALDDKFILPRRVGDQRLLAAARTFAQNAKPLSDSFVAHGMPATFLAELQVEIDHLEQALLDRVTGKDTHIAAKAAIEAAMETGLAAVHRLDAIVPNTLRDDSVALAVWHKSRHVERQPQRAVPTLTPVPPPTGGQGPVPETNATSGAAARG